MVCNSNVFEDTNVLIDFQKTGPEDKYTETFRFKEIAYFRHLLNQYGGNSYDTNSLYKTFL